MSRKKRKERKREIASLPFKQRIRKIRGWLIAMGAFFAVGILMSIFMPMLNTFLINRLPESPIIEEPTLDETCINKDAQLLEATLIKQLNATTYVFLVDGEEVTMSLAGIELTDGFTFDKKYDAHDFQLKDFIDEVVYIEYEPNNISTGYVWLAKAEVTKNNVYEYMYNAMLIYGNFANGNDDDCKYAEVFQGIEDDRPEMTGLDNWFIQKILSLIVK